MERKELISIIENEKRLYLSDNLVRQKDMRKRLHKRFLIWRYLYYFRYWQFYREQRSDESIGKLARNMAKYKSRHYEKMKNRFSYLAGVEIGGQCQIGKSLDIWHSGVVINGNVGDNCVFHGNNIIGKKGTGMELKNPTLGNSVDVGANAVIIGNVTIADNCIIGAGAVVTKSFLEPESIIVGVPGKRIN